MCDIWLRGVEDDYEYQLQALFTGVNIPPLSDAHIQEVDENITVEEILKAIKTLKVELINQYMESVSETFRKIEERHPHKWEQVQFKERDIQLQWIQGHIGVQAIEEEIEYSGRRQLQFTEKKLFYESSPTTIKALFHTAEYKLPPMTVVLYGPRGVGKTMTSWKIMQDWASGNLYQDQFDFVFYLNCRELHRFTGKMNIVEFLSQACTPPCSPDVLEPVLRDSGNHSRLLFVIDGFDELRWTLEDEYPFCHNPFVEIEVDVLFRGLIVRRVLKQCSQIITTRPLVMRSLNILVKDPRYVKVLGQTEEELSEYVHGFFSNKAEADKVLSAIKDNELLFTMCSIPTVSWIACTALGAPIMRASDLFQYRTLTSIYLLYLQRSMRHPGGDQSACSCLQKLCALANEGVLTKKFLFDEEDLDRHGLSLLEVESAFLNRNIFLQDTENLNCFSFLHPSIQEFLAALYYVLGGSSENGEEDPGLRGDTSLPRICNRSYFYSHVRLAVQFLFGLLNEKEVAAFSTSTGCPIAQPDTSAMEEWLMGENPSLFSTEAIFCLYETQNKNFIRRIVSRCPSLKVYNTWDHEMWTGKDYFWQLRFCLEGCEDFQSLTFHSFTMDADVLAMLSPFLHKSQQLSICNCDFASGSVDDFLSVLLAHRTYLNIIGKRSGMKLLKALRNLGCNKWDLSLCFNSCNMTYFDFEELRFALATNRSLAKLDLSGARLEQSGVKILYEGLKDPSCTLQELNLQRCQLPSSCWKDLCSLLTTNRSLTKMSLSWNHLDVSSIKMLLSEHQLVLLSSAIAGEPDLVQTPKCALLRLHADSDGASSRLIEERESLSNCHLTHRFCNDLCSVFITNQFLIKLDLSDNDLRDSGMKHLCKGLNHPSCILQELCLKHCHLTPLCCDDLRSVFITNRSLKKLDLFDNCLEKFRACPCDDRAFVLQMLRLHHCETSISICSALHSVITTNQALLILEATLRIRNEVSEAEVEPWCNVLRRLDCIVKNEIGECLGWGLQLLRIKNIQRVFTGQNCFLYGSCSNAPMVVHNAWEWAIDSSPVLRHLLDRLKLVRRHPSAAAVKLLFFVQRPGTPPFYAAKRADEP
ncbi:NACHT, LRR and PYD domains-containing protein 3-like [Gastrophryne carolinensis]